WVEPSVGAVNPGSPADRGGIEAGDRILGVDGQPITSWYEFVEAIRSRPSERTEVALLRDGRELTRSLVPDEREERDPETGEVTAVGQVGIYPPFEDYVFERAGALEALRFGAAETVA